MYLLLSFGFMSRMRPPTHISQGVGEGGGLAQNKQVGGRTKRAAFRPLCLREIQKEFVFESR